MALKIDLYPAGPGAARLLIAGTRPPPERVTLALQRNDGRYLGTQGQWQVTAHWHPLFTAETAPEGLKLTLGQDLVDSIVGVGGSPLRVVVRLDETEDSGTLRIHGALIGSSAAALYERTAAAGQSVEVGDTAGSGGREPSASSADADEFSLDLGGSDAAPQAPEKRRILWPWLALGALLLLAVIGGGAWWLGWIGSGAIQHPEAPPVLDAALDPSAEPDNTAQSVPPSAPPSVPETAPPVTGIALALSFLAEGPTPQAIYARAEQVEAAGDCPAAYALYSEAANTDAALAARLARRYDPLTHSAGPCIAAPDIPYAIVYYSDAAEAGDLEVQRRLGQLMAEREISGPTREAGLNWLRKAAAAGDAEAVRLLQTLSGGQ